MQDQGAGSGEGLPVLSLLGGKARSPGAGNRLSALLRAPEAWHKGVLRRASEEGPSQQAPPPYTLH